MDRKYYEEPTQVIFLEEEGVTEEGPPKDWWYSLSRLYNLW